VAGLTLAAATLGLTAAPVAAEGGTGFLDMANGYRTESDRTPVRMDARIDAIAEERADEMVADGELGHDFTDLRRKFDRDGVCWQGFGEIVAYNGSGDFADFGDQWWNSPGHKSVMLGDYTHASGARLYSEEDEGWYGVMIFVKLCNAETAGFSDIRDSKFYDDIVWLVDERITAGCSSTRFCPDGLVTRGQMATFVSRAMDLPSTAHDFFVDDEGNKHEANINRFAREEITSGCSASRFCPDGLVSRAQMATFLARALSLPPATRDWFDDDDGNSHESAINRVAEAGITNGCGPRSYCPSGAVTRGQMAAFLHRAFD
jgi:Cysteine-rich secretory protein family/S-layer homology domain